MTPETGVQKKIEHTKPPESFEKYGRSRHRLELVIDEQPVGFVEFEYHNQPFPFYYVARINVAEENRGRGFASQLMNAIDEFLVRHKKTGLIYPDGPIGAMAVRRGWKPLPTKDGWYTFNLPQHIDVRRLQKTLYALTENYVSPIPPPQL